MKYKKQTFIVLSLIMAFNTITAVADIATDLANFSQIIGNNTSGFTGMVVSMMGIFMQPPLVYFVVLGIFVTVIGIVAGLLHSRGKRK